MHIKSELPGELVSTVQRSLEALEKARRGMVAACDADQVATTRTTRSSQEMRALRRPITTKPASTSLDLETETSDEVIPKSA